MTQETTQVETGEKLKNDSVDELAAAINTAHTKRNEQLHSKYIENNVLSFAAFGNLIAFICLLEIIKLFNDVPIIDQVLAHTNGPEKIGIISIMMFLYFVLEGGWHYLFRTEAVKASEKISSLPEQQVFYFLDKISEDREYFEKVIKEFISNKNTLAKLLANTKDKKKHPFIKDMRETLKFTLTADESLYWFDEGLDKAGKGDLLEVTHEQKEQRKQLVEKLLVFMVDNDLSADEAKQFLRVLEEMLYEEADDNAYSQQRMEEIYKRWRLRDGDTTMVVDGQGLVSVTDTKSQEQIVG